MAEYSVILQSPQFRALVQENALDRMWHDALYPELLFRAEAKDEKWEANVGDNKTFTGKGLMPVSMIPLVPGQDPLPGDYPVEQWTATMNQFAGSIDTHMPTAIVAAVNKLLEDYKQLGLNAGTAMNKLARYKLYNAADAGWTVADGVQNTVTTLRVKRLNGFTRARRPDLAAGSPVRYDFVSANNPLPIIVGVSTAVNVTGFTPDIPGDELGPGTLTVSAAVTVADRDPVRASTRTFRVISGGGNATDALTAGTDILRLVDVRSAVQRLRTQNVQPVSDGTFHFHLDPTGEGQLFSDNEVQRLNIGVPDSAWYKDFAIGKLMGCTFYRNNQCPLPENVLPGGPTATFSAIDPIAGELWTNGSASTGTQVHRAIAIGRDALNEYYTDQSQLETEAGITGKVTKGARVTNDGFEVNVERIRVINRAPLDRLQQNVSTTWSFMGDFVMRTDGASGDPAVFKRVVAVLSSD